MAMISLKKGGAFFADVQDYNWKGKFLVVSIPEIVIGDKPEIRIIHWDNIESVYDTEYREATEK